MILTLSQKTTSDDLCEMISLQSWTWRLNALSLILSDLWRQSWESNCLRRTNILSVKKMIRNAEYILRMREFRCWSQKILVLVVESLLAKTVAVSWSENKRLSWQICHLNLLKDWIRDHLFSSLKAVSSLHEFVEWSFLMSEKRSDDLLF